MPRSRSPRAITFSHCAMALAVFLKGIAKAEDLAHNWPLVALCCSCGVLIFLFVLFHHQIEKTWLRVSPLVSVLESIVAVALGVYSLRHGQRMLPYAWFFAAAGAGVAAVVQWVALRRKSA
jgi:drug/metabolite transporter (DMT)-like permease